MRYSHSCTDLASYVTFSTPRDSAHSACYRVHLSPTPPTQGCQTPSPPDHSHRSHTPTPPEQSSRRPSSTPSTHSYPQLPPKSLLSPPHRPVTATRSAPRAVTPYGRWRLCDSSSRHSPGRRGPTVPGGVGNGGLGARDHQGVGPQMSWSPATQAKHTPIRPRVYSDCNIRSSQRSRSFRIKQWIQARQRR